MPNNKNNEQGGSKSSMGSSSDREFEDQGQNSMSGRSSQGQQGQGSTSGGYGKDTGMQGGMMDDDEMNTSGGREGQFSDKNRDSESQWSPGSSGGPSD